MTINTTNTSSVISSHNDCHIFAYGDTGIVLESIASSDPFDIEILTRQNKILQLAKNLRNFCNADSIKRSAIIDIVPGNQNLLVIFDPLNIDVDSLSQTLKTLWDTLNNTTPAIDSYRPEAIELPIHYGGKYGPDLGAVADYHQITTDQVIALHTSSIYTVLFNGFQPGFPYLQGLKPELATPRLEQPRTSIAAGSVGIGGSQTGIYPFSSPGGWQIIGRYLDTKKPLFDHRRDTPILLSAGIQLRFIAS